MILRTLFSHYYYFLFVFAGVVNFISNNIQTQLSIIFTAVKSGDPPLFQLKPLFSVKLKLAQSVANSTTLKLNLYQNTLEIKHNQIK